MSWMAAREVVEELKWKGVGQVYDWPRLSNLNSTLELSSLVVLCGVIAGVSEVCFFFLFRPLFATVSGVELMG